ncbi:MAG: hypothetical protein AAGI88_19260 [Pseudomonadota bacterium]
MLNKALLPALVLAASQALAQQPTLNLFPTRVVDSIQQTTEVAQQMETEIQSVLTELDRQYELFESANCADAQSDAGCVTLRRDVAESYQQMLDIMARDLPKMKEIVAEARVGMGEKIRRELGQRRSAKDLQALLQANDGRSLDDIRRRRAATGNRMRMSEKFRQYAQLVSTTQNETSLTLLAADFYLDLDETDALIEFAQQEVTRAKVIGQIDLAMGGFTPQMLGNISNIKRMLFGSSEDGPVLPMPAPAIEDVEDNDWVM